MRFAWSNSRHGMPGDEGALSRPGAATEGRPCCVEPDKGDLQVPPRGAGVRSAGLRPSTRDIKAAIMPDSSPLDRFGDAVKATFTALDAVKVAFRDLRADEKCETSVTPHPTQPPRLFPHHSVFPSFAREDFTAARPLLRPPGRPLLRRHVGAPTTPRNMCTKVGADVAAQSRKRARQ